MFSIAHKGLNGCQVPGATVRVLGARCWVLRCRVLRCRVLRAGCYGRSTATWHWGTWHWGTWHWGTWTWHMAAGTVAAGTWHPGTSSMIQLPTAIYMISGFENSHPHHLSRRADAHTRRRGRPLLRRRIHRSLGRGRARRRHAVFPGAPPLDGPGWRLDSRQRRPAHHRAVPDDQQRRRSRSTTR